MAQCVILELAKNVSKLARAQNVIESQRRRRTCRVASVQVCSVASATLTVIQQVYKSIAALKAFRQAGSQPATSNEKLDSAANARYSLPAHSTKGCAPFCVSTSIVRGLSILYCFFHTSFIFKFAQLRTLDNRNNLASLKYKNKKSA